MASSTSFVPKQACPRTGPYMKIILGDVTLNVAREVIEKYISPLPVGSLVHDNGCGNGVVTQVILEASGNHDVQVEATDLGPTMVEMTQAMVSTNKWDDSVRASVMNAEALGFEDDKFTHSIANFLIHTGPDAQKVTAEIYRTLKPGGSAYVTCWTEVAHDAAVLDAHAATRPPNTPHPNQAKEVWKKPSHLKKVLEQAGFRKVGIIPIQTYLEIEDLKYWLTVGWSFAGPTADGWSQKDEENWEKAIEAMYKRFSSSDMVTMRPDGSCTYKMIASLAIATK